MRVTGLKALARDLELRNYSRMRKAGLVALLQNNPQPGQSHASAAPTPHTRPPHPDRPPPPAPRMSPSGASPRGTTWEPIDDRRLRKPTQQEMDIFEQREMSKSRPQVKSKLKKWYDWLIDHVPKPIKDGASRAFKTFKHKIMGLYNRVTGFTQRSAGPSTAERGAASAEPKPFKPIELEQAFGGSYRSYRVNGRPKIDVDTLFNRIRKELIELIKRELKTRTSARIQTTTWIRFIRNEEE